MSKPRTLIELLEDRARHDPEAEAFTFRDKAVSYRSLLETIERVAATLVERGLERGARVVIALPNGLEFFGVFYGVQKAGGIPVPTFPGSGVRQLARLAARCAAESVVVESAEAGGAISAGALGAMTATDLLAAASRGFDPVFPVVTPDDLAYIQYTSGTTGDPKGVQLSHQNVLVNIRQLTAGFEITSDDVFVSWLPAYHDMGLVLMTMVPFALGARLVLLPASLRSIRPWLDAIEAHGGTFTASPDFGYRVALRLVQGEDGPDLPELASLRVALNAAEPVRASTIARFEEAFGLGAVMIAGYGLAEATVGVSAWAPGSPPKVDAAGSVSVGTAFPEVDVAILGDGEILGSNEPGEILVRSPAATRGYLSRILSGEKIQEIESDTQSTGTDGADAEENLFWKDGFLHTGDLGYVDDDGDLFVSGRLKQMIIQAGRNIAPREVEEIVDALPFIRRSAAIGVDRGDDAGEQLYVVAEMREHAKPEDDVCRDLVVTLVDRVHAHLGFRPGRVYLAAPRTVPFTANGKVRYGELKDAFRSGRLREAGQLWYPDW